MILLEEEAAVMWNIRKWEHLKQIHLRVSGHLAPPLEPAGHPGSTAPALTQTRELGLKTQFGSRCEHTMACLPFSHSHTVVLEQAAGSTFKAGTSPFQTPSGLHFQVFAMAGLQNLRRKGP